MRPPLTAPAPQSHALGSATALALLATLPVSVPAHAQGLGAGGDDESSSWGLEIGVTSSQKLYAGIDRKTTAIPLHPV